MSLVCCALAAVAPCRCRGVHQSDKSKQMLSKQASNSRALIRRKIDRKRRVLVNLKGTQQQAKIRVYKNWYKRLIACDSGAGAMGKCRSMFFGGQGSAG